MLAPIFKGTYFIKLMRLCYGCNDNLGTNNKNNHENASDLNPLIRFFKIRKTDNIPTGK